MNCPVCNDPMVVLELDQVEVDHCLTCGGVWLDAGELKLLLEGAENRDQLLGTFKVVKKTSEDKIRCPICSKYMTKMLCGATRGVWIDSCPKNEGLWFDRGELTAIVEMCDFPADRRLLQLLKGVFGKSG